MDALPTPDFREYYEQLRLIWDLDWVTGTKTVEMPVESSRGCWWGEKHHCTFCGLNGSTMGFRQKSPEKVVAELLTQLQLHPNNKVRFVDNIMPLSYYETLLPKLAEIGTELDIFYEQKANVTFAKMKLLRAAGVRIQPEIKSLSTALLQRMRKGVSATQNIMLLRFCLTFGVAVAWNLLHDFPGDHEEEF